MTSVMVVAAPAQIQSIVQPTLPGGVKFPKVISMHLWMLSRDVWANPANSM